MHEHFNRQILLSVSSFITSKKVANHLIVLHHLKNLRYYFFLIIWWAIIVEESSSCHFSLRFFYHTVNTTNIVFIINVLIINKGPNLVFQSPQKMRFSIPWNFEWRFSITGIFRHPDLVFFPPPNVNMRPRTTRRDPVS